MTTLFSLLMQGCGLSQREAALYLNTRLDTVKSWASGRRQPPPKVLDDLAALADKIERAASAALARIETLRAEHGAPDQIELGVAEDDAVAQALGWPCVGAQVASLGLIAARGTMRGYKFRLVKRGSTPATAGAAHATKAAKIILAKPQKTT